MNLENIGLGVLVLLEELGKAKQESEKYKKSGDDYMGYWLKAQSDRDELQKELDVFKTTKSSENV